MKYIKLTRDKVVIVDDDDYELLSKHKWHYSEYGNGKGYAKRYNPQKKPSLLRMHRVILNASSGLEVDHINRNTLDNRKTNLRLVTKAQNTMNKTAQANNTSGFKGVCWHKQNDRWRAYITLDGKQISLGLYDDKKDAARAYNEAAKNYHGDYAYLNPL